MLKKELILQNPLRFLENETGDILLEGGFGAVLARAGVGKTAILVQLALNTILKGKNVLHISLDDPVKKLTLWYKEVFNHLTKQYESIETKPIWESILPHRFIMTFRVEGFSTSKLEERLTDLIEQNIFSPQVIIIDGFNFKEDVRTSLSDLKRLAKKHFLYVWFSVKTHRHEEPGSDGMPAQILEVVDLFDLVIQLQPKGKEIHIKTLKGVTVDSDQRTLLLDPETMLVKDSESK
ncbi:MAG: AAA family ATPase [Proteobacteria bacterium]|nr:AAA family ATPase [Pseudomonadota bacterium]